VLARETIYFPWPVALDEFYPQRPRFNAIARSDVNLVMASRREITRTERRFETKKGKGEGGKKAGK